MRARAGAAAFLATVASLLGTTDKWCILYPTVKRLLRSDIKEITALALLDNAREPVRFAFLLGRPPEVMLTQTRRSRASYSKQPSRGLAAPASRTSGL